MDGLNFYTADPELEADDYLELQEQRVADKPPREQDVYMFVAWAEVKKHSDCFPLGTDEWIQEFILTLPPAVKDTRRAQRESDLALLANWLKGRGENLPSRMDAYIWEFAQFADEPCEK